MAKGKDVCAHLGCTNEATEQSVMYQEIAPGVHRPVSRLGYCSEHISQEKWTSDLSTFVQDRNVAIIANNWEGR